MDCMLCEPPASARGGSCWESWRTGRLGALEALRTPSALTQPCLRPLLTLLSMDSSDSCSPAAKSQLPTLSTGPVEDDMGLNVQAAAGCPPAQVGQLPLLTICHVVDTTWEEEGTMRGMSGPHPVPGALATGIPTYQ